MNEKKLSKNEKLESLFSEIEAARETKSKNISARLSEADYVMLRAKAKLAGMSMSDFVVDAVRSKRVAGYDEIKGKIEDILKDQDGLEV